MRIFLLIMMFLCLSSAAMAQQNETKIDLFTGYSFINVEPNFNTDRVNLNGWESGLRLKIIPVVELEADFSGHYGSINGANVNMYTVVVGPRFGRDGKRINWFVHSLYGLSRISGEGNVLTPALGVPSDTSFAFVPGGGGIEINLNKKIAYRVFQFDPIITVWQGGGSQWQTRFSTGLVFHIK